MILVIEKSGMLPDLNVKIGIWNSKRDKQVFISLNGIKDKDTYVALTSAVLKSHLKLDIMRGVLEAQETVSLTSDVDLATMVPISISERASKATTLLELASIGIESCEWIESNMPDQVKVLDGCTPHTYGLRGICNSIIAKGGEK